MTARPSDDAARLVARAVAARDAGRLAEAQAHAEAAWQATLAAPADPAHAHAGHLLCLLAYRTGALPRLLALGREVLPLLAHETPRDRQIDLLRWMALAGGETGRFEEAMRHAREACGLAHDARDPRQLALSLTALGACFERLGDPWQAERLMDEALAFADESADPFARLVTLNNLCAVCVSAFYLLRDGDDAAEGTAALRRALVHARAAHALLPAFGDPFLAVFVEGNLGEVLLHLGNTEEARHLLDAALQRGMEHGFEAPVWRVRCSICELMLAQGQADEALPALDALLADMVDLDASRATLVRVHHALYRACRALGRPADALAHLEEHDRLVRRRSTHQLQAQSRLFVTRVEAEHVRQQAERAHREAQRERSRAADLEADARRDQLTGLGNRRHLEQLLPARLDAAEAQHEPLAMALVDLDHFKRINDRYGHAVGDRVLVELAQLLREETRVGDIVVRMGGEEFLIVLPGAPPAQAREACERLRARVEAHAWDAVAPGAAVTLSIGIAHAPPYRLEPLFDAADRAMYRAKQDGRNRVAG